MILQVTSMKNPNAKMEINSEKSEIVAFRQNSQANNPEANVLKTESITDEESLQRTTIRIAMPREEDEEDVFKPNHASGSKFWILGFLLGFLSGFLGGLSGLRSGPILIFFLHFDYPKPIIRANLMIVTCVNTYVRIIYYLIEDVAGTNSVVWFERDFWYLYVCIIIAGLLGVPLGSRLEAKINQTRYNSIIVAALIIAGSMSMIKGSIDISKLKNR